MIFKPHDYQRYCINRIINEKQLGLLLDMGLGKTSITLTALNELIFYKHNVNRVLVIAPKRVAETTWTAEALKWEHLKHIKFSKILGTRKQRQKAIQAEADIYIINRENVAWLVENYKDNWIWDCVVIDELSSFKNPSAIRFKKLKQVLPHINRIYGLTGTPASNGLIDLWAQIYLLDRGKRLGKTVTSYRNEYFLPDKRNAFTVFTYKLKAGAEERIRENISDLCVSIDSSEYVSLPERIDMKTVVKLDPKVLNQYESMERDMLLELPEGEISAVNAAAVTNKLLQIASGCVYDESGSYHVIHDSKLEALKEIIEAAGDDPVLVFYNFKHEKERILEEFKGSVVLDTEQDAKAWNEGKIKLLLAHPASSGYGLNLQDGGHIIVWLSPTWNLEQYQQANARLFRQGQKQPVIIQHVLAEGTIDNQVMKVLEGKDKEQSALLKALEAKLKELKDKNVFN